MREREVTERKGSFKVELAKFVVVICISNKVNNLNVARTQQLLIYHTIVIVELHLL